MSEGKPGRALLLVPLLGLLWGFNWPAVRISLTEIAPWTLRAAGMSFARLVLVAVALAGVFLAVDRFSIAYALLGAVAAAVASAALSVALQPLGLPTLTLPFVLVTWVFLFAAPRLGALRAASAA